MTAIEAAARFGRLTDDDIPAARLLSQNFGWPHRLDDWRLMLRLGTGIAAHDASGTLVGSAVAWTWADRVTTAGLILVRRDRQGQGIGQRLLDRLRDVAGGKSMRLYATPEGKKLYVRQGFVTSGRIVQVQGEISLQPAAHHVRRATQSDLTAIVALDAAAFGVPRERLFDLLLDGGEAYVLGPADAPVAFAVRRRFGLGNHIGPVVAPDAGSAQDLIVTLIQPGFNRLDVTSAAAPIGSYLSAIGFKEAAVVEEMTLGRWPQRRDETVFALASQSFG